MGYHPRRETLRRLAGRLVLPTALAMAIAAQPTALASAAHSAGPVVLAPDAPPNRTDDFDLLQERRTIRVLVPYSRTFFHIDHGRQKGVTHEVGIAFERWLNKRYPRKGGSLGWHVMFIPVARDQLIPSLVRGVGDIAAGGLVEGDRPRFGEQVVAAPGSFRADPVLVNGPGGKPVGSLDQLAGKEIAVPAMNSDFWELVELSSQFSERGLQPIHLVPLAEGIEPEDLLELVNAGTVPAAVVDRRVAQAWKPALGRIEIQDEVELDWGGQYAWVVRRGNPELQRVLAAFFAEHRRGTRLDSGEIEAGRYLGTSASADELRSFRRLNRAFIASAERYDLDPLMLMAQAFHESQFNQRARSRRGAVGVMQVLPSTAADPNVRVSGVVASAEKNVEAASKYLRFLADTYLDDPSLTPENRMFMLLAAYNAGPGNLQKVRRMTRESGLDPDRWFGNVEKVAGRVLGRETLNYVNNVYKYYVAYRFAQDLEEERPLSLADGQGHR